jgi:hypothetical protein
MAKKKTPKKKLRNLDVMTRDEGSIVLFTPMTDVAKDWISEHIPDDAQWFGRSLVVEHRFSENIAIGMRNDGLQIELVV